MSRKPISKKTRFDVFKRDGFACQYCGAHPPAVILHVDHIHPVAEGGDNDPGNLITACEPCNLGKGARLLSSVPETLADKAARVAEAEEQLAGYSAAMQAKRERVEADVWTVVETLTGETSIRRDRYASIKLFVERLGVHAAIEAAELARCRVPWERKRFLYFCKVCWNQIRENEGVEDGQD